MLGRERFFERFKGISKKHLPGLRLPKAVLAPSLRECIWNIDLPTYQLRVSIYLEPKWPLFLKVNPPKQGLFQSKRGSLWVPGIYIYMYEFVLKSNDIPQDFPLNSPRWFWKIPRDISSLSNSVISFCFFERIPYWVHFLLPKKTSTQKKKTGKTKKHPASAATTKTWPHLELVYDLSHKILGMKVGASHGGRP